MSCWMRGDLISAGSSSFVRTRSTGCPIRATFRIDIAGSISYVEYRFCPYCAGALEKRSLKAGDPDRLVCGACGFVFYLDPKVAVGTIITPADSRPVPLRPALEPGAGVWVFPGVLLCPAEAAPSAASPH